MLVYNPAFDIYHTILRILKIVYKIDREIEIDRIRIYDFLFLFPFHIRKIRLPREAAQIRKLLPNQNPYSEISNPKKIFEKMEPYQLIAIKSIVAFGFFDETAFSLGKIKLSNQQVPDDLKGMIVRIEDSRKNALIVISQYLDNISLYGKDGLKSRSELIEFRYDSI